MSDVVSSESAHSIPVWKSIAVIAFGVVLLVICKITPDATTISDPGVLMSLPHKIGDYWGNSMEASQAEKLGLPSDTEFERKMYESTEGDQVMCSIVLSGANRRSIHRPEACLPGQGWTIKTGQVLSIPIENHPPLEVMNLTLTRPVELPNQQRKTLNSYYFYWFVGHNRTTPHHKYRIFFSSWDRVFHHENHRWAYCIVHSQVTEGWKYPFRDSKQTLQIMKDFTQKIAPRFMKLYSDGQEKSFSLDSTP